MIDASMIGDIKMLSHFVFRHIKIYVLYAPYECQHSSSFDIIHFVIPVVTIVSCIV
jgi:hypothetical protein